MNRTAPARRAAFVRFTTITTRWLDNDVFAHLNNAHYYSFFDTAICTPLVEAGLLDPAASRLIPVVVESGCRYRVSLGFPDLVHAGIRVAHLGRRSVRYEIGLFRNAEPEAAAEGFFVHVYVAREDMRPAPIPDDIRAALAALQKKAGSEAPGP